MVLVAVYRDLLNPAFIVQHPSRNIVYACTESILENGDVVAFSVSPTSGVLRKIDSQTALGTSTCYVEINREESHMLVTNYWDSTLAVIPIDRPGTLKPATDLWAPVKKVKAEKRADHLKNRQLEPHNHSIILDPVHGRMAYVPDLGEDVIRQFVFENDKLTFTKTIPASLNSGARGPRYLVFHPTLKAAYVINELSSTITVFEFDQVAACLHSLENPVSTLHNIQEISTLPLGFPSDLNTCGRITVDPTGKFVLASNRGHNSITVFRVGFNHGGSLALAGIFHTGGRTPRHFTFDGTGKLLLVANQDTDNVSIFRFNQETGALVSTQSEYDIPSPNFVCCVNVTAPSADSKL